MGLQWQLKRSSTTCECEHCSFVFLTCYDFASYSSGEFFWRLTSEPISLGDRQRKNLELKLKLLAMCATRIWLGFLDIALKGPIGTVFVLP